MDVEYIKKMLDNQRFSYGGKKWRHKGNHYQSYTIDGTYIRGRRNTEIRIKQMNLPTSLNGFNFLDIGCNIGAMCMEVKKRGASLVVGVDIFKDNITAANKIAKFNKFDINFIKMDICKHSNYFINSMTKHKFDYVFALSIIPHISEKCLTKILNKINTTYIFFEAHKSSVWKNNFSIFSFIKKNKLNAVVEKSFGESLDDKKHRLLWLLKKRK